MGIPLPLASEAGSHPRPSGQPVPGRSALTGKMSFMAETMVQRLERQWRSVKYYEPAAELHSELIHGHRIAFLQKRRDLTK